MSVFQQFVERKFGKDFCFLCGTTLSEGNRTDEHVVPCWPARMTWQPVQVYTL